MVWPTTTVLAEEDIIIDCDDVSISGSLSEICDYVRVTHDTSLQWRIEPMSEIVQQKSLEM